MNNPQAEIRKTLYAINQAWCDGKPFKMKQYLHPDIIMVFPGFKGSIKGRNNLLDGFMEFCSTTQVLEYEENDEQIQVISDCAFASFRFNMLYERENYRERSTGRDFWVFHREENKWIAVWRTMLELEEVRETIT